MNTPAKINEYEEGTIDGFNGDPMRFSSADYLRGYAAGKKEAEAQQAWGEHTAEGR